MSAPSELPEWAASGAIVRPSDGQIAAGWAPGQKPPAQFVNWWENLVWKWLNFFGKNLGVELFGDGSDGTAVFDGTNTFAFASKSGSVYTLSRDVNLAVMTINNGVTVHMAGYRVFVSQTLTLVGSTSVLDNDGFPAVAGTGGPNTAPDKNIGYGSAGGNGGTSGSNNGSPGAQNPITGTDPVISAGGIGGAGHAAGGSGGAGGGVGSSTDGFGRRSIRTALTGYTESNKSGTPSLFMISGGTGGGGGGYDTDGIANATNGGGGGQGGGVGVVFASTIINNGRISCRGGNGGQGAQDSGSSPQPSGGGGGGGGGVLYFGHVSYSGTGTVSVAGGTGGAAGDGGGNVGAAGAAGMLVEYDLTSGGGVLPVGPHEEHGVATMSTTGSGSGVDYLDVVFATAFADTNYNFDAAIYNSTGLFINWVIVSMTTSGMRIAITEPFNGKISWKASE